MFFIDDPGRRRRLSRWLIGVITICLVIYLALRYVDVVGDAAGSLIKLFSPLIMGVVIALIINVPMRPIERILFPRAQKEILKKIRRPLAIVLAFLLVVGILTCVVSLIVPELVQALTVLGEGVMWLAKNFGEWSDSFASDTLVVTVLDKLNLDFATLQEKALEWLKTSGPKIITSTADTITGIGSSIFNFVVGLVFSFYVLFDKEKLKNQTSRMIRAWIPKRGADAILHIADVSNGIFRSFVVGQFTEAVVLGTLCMIGMLILRIPYAPMVGALVGVTALIPVFGALIGMLVGAIMIVSVSPIKALIFVIFLIILQQLEGDLIYPRVVGSRIGLPGMWVLAAVTIGGSLGGAIGMLLGVPVVSVIYTLTKEVTLQREEQIGSGKGKNAIMSVKADVVAPSADPPAEAQDKSAAPTDLVEEDTVSESDTEGGTAGA